MTSGAPTAFGVFIFSALHPRPRLGKEDGRVHVDPESSCLFGASLQEDYTVARGRGLRV